MRKKRHSQSATEPQLSARIEQALDLSGHSTKSSWHTEEETIGLRQLIDSDDRHISSLWRRVHLLQHVSGQSLGHLEELGLNARLLETFDNSSGQLLDVAVCRVVDNIDDWNLAHFGLLELFVFQSQSNLNSFYM